MFGSLVYAILAPSTWSLYCAGDIMLNGVSPSRPVFNALKVPTDAIFYANLEIPLTNVSERTSRKSAADVQAKNQFILTADTKHINHLKSAGIDVVSLGNNHAMDAGASGLGQMIKLLDGSGIRHVGAGTDWSKAVEPAIVVAPDGTRVAFLSYLSFLSHDALRKCTPATMASAGIATLTMMGKNGPKELKTLKMIVDKAKTKADVVVVALHWGIERQPFPALYQVALGRLFVDAGADVILGAHPHVLQPAEIYKGKPIIYSLGNFVNPGGGSSAIYKLTFSGSKFQYGNIWQTSYSGGVVKTGGWNPASLVNPEPILLKKYPSKDSRPFKWVSSR